MPLEDKRTKLAVIIPAYNEEKSIGEVIKRIPQNVCDEVEIIVVDDGSTDKTDNVAREVGAYVVNHGYNRGLTQTLKTGINVGFDRNADYFLTIDADGQYLPEDIPKLLQPLLERKADLVLGSRFMGGIEEMPWLKRSGNRMFTWLLRRLTGFPFSDTQTGFRAFNRHFVESVFLHGKYTYTQEMLIHAVEKGFRIKEVPTFFAKRKHGKSRLITNPLTYATRAFMIIMRTYRDYHPMKLFGVLGVILMGAGLILGGYLTALWLMYGVVGRIPSVILTVLLIMSGIMSLIFGFLADMLITLREELRETIRRSRS